MIKTDDPKMIALFFKDVCKDKPLSRDAERELWRKVQKGSKAARDEILLRNMRLVAVTCNLYAGHGVPIMDLFIEGFFGLHEAAKRFTPGTGFKFTSYAIWWVRQRIIRALAKGHQGYSRPTRFFMDLRDIRKAEKEGRPVDMTPTYLARVERTARGIVSTEVGRVGECIACDQPGPETTVEEMDTQSAIGDAVRSLSSKERRVVSLFFGLGGVPAHSLREVAERVGLTRERVRQIKLNALDKLERDGSLREICLTN